ncbi:MAG TPA: LppP/LprE family lipoprotein [Candidatus Dormibacteraeota bacterium]|nr:LppP/LprE family lipoprotein [Candidatus Dormibacteraeota bacterium]
MTELLLVAVLGAGGVLVLMIAGRTLRRSGAGFMLVALIVGILFVLVAGSAGLTALHRAVGNLDIRIGPEPSTPHPSPAPAPSHAPGPPPPASADAVPATTHIAGPPPSQLDAERQVAALGYQVDDPGTYHPEYALHVLLGSAGDGHTVPHHEWAFFFAGDGVLLGEDVRLPSASVIVVGQGPAFVSLAYQLYAPTDADCCPSLGKAAVRYRLGPGSRLLRLDPLPPRAERRACCPAGATPAVAPIPRGSRRQ